MVLHLPIGNGGGKYPLAGMNEPLTGTSLKSFVEDGSSLAGGGNGALGGAGGGSDDSNGSCPASRMAIHF